VRCLLTKLFTKLVSPGYKSIMQYVTTLQVMAGKMMEQGPVLIISFHAQQIMAVRDKKGNVVEGDKVKKNS
jgi:import inner membrane translocase subunit TIM44